MLEAKNNSLSIKDEYS